jgi:hypothetical protein
MGGKSTALGSTWAMTANQSVVRKTEAETAPWCSEMCKGQWAAHLCPCHPPYMCGSQNYSELSSKDSHLDSTKYDIKRQLRHPENMDQIITATKTVHPKAEGTYTHRRHTELRHLHTETMNKETRMKYLLWIFISMAVLWKAPPFKVKSMTGSKRHIQRNSFVPERLYSFQSFFQSITKKVYLCRANSANEQRPRTLGTWR